MLGSSEEVLGVTKVLDNGFKTSIPKRVREILDIEPNDELVWFIVEEFIGVKKQSPKRRRKR